MARVADFKPATKNANRHSARGLGALTASVQSDGWIGAMTTAAEGAGRVLTFSRQLADSCLTFS